jgi:hypothetical protein
LLVKLYQEEADEKFIMLPKCELIEDYNPFDFYNLTLIKLQQGGFYNFVHTGVNMLLSQQGMSVKNSSNKSNTKESMIRLIDSNYIEVFEDAHCESRVEDIKPANAYFVTTTGNSDKSTNGGKDMYAKIFHSDLKKIMGIDSNYKSNLFSVYHAIIGCVRYDKVDDNGKIVVQQSDRLSYPSVDRIAERTGLNRKTVMSCLQSLHDAEVFYALTVRVESKKDRNFYCRWIYKNYIKGWVDAHLGEVSQEYLIENGIFE